MHVIGIGGKAGNKGRIGDRVLLGSGKGSDTAEQIPAQIPGDLPGNVGGHAVGHTVEQPGQQRRQCHQPAHQPHPFFTAGALGIIVDDHRQHGWQEQLDHRAGNFDQHLEADAFEIRPDILCDGGQRLFPPFTDEFIVFV